MLNKLSALVSKTQHLVHALIIGAVTLCVGCDTSEVDETTKLGVKIEVDSVGESSISFKINSTNATEVRYLVVKASEGMCDAEAIFATGSPSKVNTEYAVKEVNLESNIPYLIAVAARSGERVEVAYDIVTTAPKHYNEVALDFSLVRRLLSEDYCDTEYALLFTDVDPEYELILVFNAEPGAILPEGDYTTDGGINATIDAKRSFLSFANGEEPIYFERVDVAVQVPYDRDKYLITAHLYAGDTLYEVVVYDYVGNMPVYDTSNLVFNYPTIRKKDGGKRATIVFDTEDEKATLVLDTYLFNPNNTYLTPGEYKIKSGNGDFKAGDIDAQNSWFIANGYYGEVVSGTVNITINNDYDYLFVIDVIDELGREIKCEYCGFVPEVDFDRQFTLDSIAITEIEGGRYHVDFGGNYTLSFDICAEVLAEGSYPIAEAGESQSPYVDKATISFSSPLDNIAIKGGKVRILDLEDDYVIFSFELRAQDNYYIWRGEYCGDL
jgi:hypothetical protein